MKKRSRTCRDGEEVDFIVESSAGVFPVEVKLGLPKAAEIVSRNRILIDDLQEGAVVSLAAAHSAGRLLCDYWRFQDLSFQWFDRGAAGFPG